MRILSGMQRRMRITTTVDPMLLCAILVISALVVVFVYYLSPMIAYSQTKSFPSNPLYKSIVSNSSNTQPQMQQRSESKVIEASGHFANNQIENDSVSWIQGGLWHLAVYNS